MTITVDEIMYEIKNYFTENIVSASYMLFIEPLEAVCFDNGHLTLKANSEWSKSIIDERFKDKIQAVVERYLGKEVTVNIIVDN